METHVHDSAHEEQEAEFLAEADDFFSRSAVRNEILQHEMTNFTSNVEEFWRDADTFFKKAEMKVKIERKRSQRKADEVVAWVEEQVSLKAKNDAAGSLINVDEPQLVAYTEVEDFVKSILDGTYPRPIITHRRKTGKKGKVPLPGSSHREYYNAEVHDEVPVDTGYETTSFTILNNRFKYSAATQNLPSSLTRAANQASVQNGGESSDEEPVLTPDIFSEEEERDDFMYLPRTPSHTGIPALGPESSAEYGNDVLGANAHKETISLLDVVDKDMFLAWEPLQPVRKPAKVI